MHSLNTAARRLVTRLNKSQGPLAARTRRLLSQLHEQPIPLTPQELQAARHGPKVLANSMPKSGTHLLVRICSLLPLMVPRWNSFVVATNPAWEQKVAGIRRGQYLASHLYWSPKLMHMLQANQIRPLFIIRDLRDVAWSTVHYLTNVDTRHRLHPYFKALGSDDERLMAVIVGVDGALLPDGVRSKSFGEHATGFLPWASEPGCLLMRFEDLIGARGGGSVEAQIDAVRQVIGFLGMDLPETQIHDLAAKVFHTEFRVFRKGAIGDWSNHFNQAHKRAFKEVAGEALMKFGYAKDNNW